MLRNRFSAALLALLLAVTIPATVFATDIENDSTQTNPTTVQEPDAEADDEILPEQEGTEPEPSDVADPDAGDPAADNDEPGEAGEPGNDPIGEENVPKGEIDEPAAVNEEDVTDVEEPAIVEESLTVTLTIIHRLVFDDQHSDMIQTFEGLGIEQIVNLDDYAIKNIESIVCISNPTEMKLSDEEVTVVLEYNPIAREIQELEK